MQDDSAQNDDSTQNQFCYPVFVNIPNLVISTECMMLTFGDISAYLCSNDALKHLNS